MTTAAWFQAQDLHLPQHLARPLLRSAGTHAKQSRSARGARSRWSSRIIRQGCGVQLQHTRTRPCHSCFAPRRTEQEAAGLIISTLLGTSLRWRGRQKILARSTTPSLIPGGNRWDGKCQGHCVCCPRRHQQLQTPRKYPCLQPSALSPARIVARGWVVLMTSARCTGPIRCLPLRTLFPS